MRALTILVLTLTATGLVLTSCSNSTGIPSSELPLRIAYVPDKASSNIDSLFVCNDKGEQQQFITAVKGIHSIFWPPEGEKIYFQENHESPSQSIIYSTDKLVGVKKEVYKASGLFTMETVSRDGKLIIIRMREPGSEKLELFRLDAIQGGMKKVSNGTTEDAIPALSPNVTMLAYAGSLPEQNFSNLYLLNLFTNARTQITDFENTLIYSITFSPGNSYIYFSCRKETEANYENYLMRYALGTQTLDTLTSFRSSSAKDRIDQLIWSDNKSQLAFFSANDGSGYGYIFIMDQNGNNLRQITSTAARYSQRGFDGKAVYFSYNQIGQNGIYKIDTGSSEITPLFDCLSCTDIVWNFNSVYK